MIIACSFVLTLADLAWTQPVVFGDVQTRFSKSAIDRRLVDKDADLILDDSARKLIVKNQEHPLDVSYDDIQKVVFDVSTHMRGGAMGGLLGGLGGSRRPGGRGLTVDESRLLFAFLTRSNLASGLGQAPPSLVGKTVGDLIAEQRTFEAVAKKRAEEQTRLAAEAKAKEEALAAELRNAINLTVFQ